ncbi:MAG: peroxide stress protein YaaA [Bacteroidetes bacterium]|nr:peroxide stress protein YaaA [Bacteroidota bacterium]
MPKFSILLPPAEGKQEGGNPFAPDMFDYRTSNTFNYFHQLKPERRQLIDHLHTVIKSGEHDLGALFGLKEAALETAVKANLEIYKAPLISALDRYAPGVMYQAMDFPGLPTGAQRRLLEEGIIFSGMFGLLRPDDLIPMYKMKMDADIPGLGKVGDFWKEPLSKALNQTLKDRWVWNFLPGIHEAAWSNEVTYEAMVRVKFFTQKGGVREPVNHGVKPLRGKLVNYIVKETVEDLDLLIDWKHPDGYVLDPSVSSFDEESRTHVLSMVKRG